MHKEKQQQSEAETGEKRKRERESASGNYDFGSLLLLLFFLAYFGRKTQKRYMKLSRSKFPRIIYVRKDKNKKHNVETSVKVAQREAPN